MRIDAHQHFWKYHPAEYPWIKPSWPIRRDFGPADLVPELAAAQLDASIAVQARQSLAENHWLLGLADQSERVAGVVGWVDLRSDHVREQLAEFAAHPKFVGVRHVVQDEPDPNFMLGREFMRGIQALAEFELTYDLLVFPNQLPAAIGLARKFPEQPLVLDHIAKPYIARGIRSPWQEQIRELAQCPNVHCKLSGLITEADHASWHSSQFVPYLETVWSAFGEDRVMYGSDWPVCLLAGTYQQVFRLVDDYTRPLSDRARAKFFGENTARFYGLD